jgi:NAD(P) transhydrogenase subunit alpha
MLLAVPKELVPGERRVAMTPQHLPALAKSGITIAIEAGAGEAAGFPDAQFQEKGAKIVANRDELFAQADGILQVQTAAYAPEESAEDLARFKPGQVVIGHCDPLANYEAIAKLAEKQITLLAVELLPRITRAQSMDVLSSMATLAGYKAVLLAAAQLPRIFPMLMTAAGTIPPSKVLVLGAGVAGLQAIATAKRLGAVVSAYDVRPVVKEQVESVGGRFVDLGLDTKDAEGAGGYAKEQSADFIKRQQDALGRVIAEHEVVITTAVIPGKKAPILMTAEMVRQMMPGSVIVDMAAERGGNCELTVRGETTVVAPGVTILGVENLPSTMPYDASQMYGKNLANLVKHLVSGGGWHLSPDDPITAGILTTREGHVVNPTIRKLLGLDEKPPEMTIKMD